MDTLFGTQRTQTPRTLTSRSLATPDLDEATSRVKWAKCLITQDEATNSLLNHDFRVALGCLL